MIELTTRVTKQLGIACAFIAMTMTSCIKDDKAPVYFSIDSIGLTSNYASQGTASHNIKDAWVYVDGQELGVYELPARFPVLAEGRHEITIAAGIFINGISATRIKYPFYNFLDTVLNFQPGVSDLSLGKFKVKYFEGQTYTWYEDFEATGYTFQANISSDVQVEIDNIDKFEGNNSGRATLISDKPKFYGEMQVDSPIVSQNKTFLELNYKSEQAFSVGMKVTTAGFVKTVYILTVNKSDTWNKIYVDLSKVVNENQTASGFSIYIYAELESGRSQSVLHFDNMKLLHN